MKRLLLALTAAALVFAATASATATTTYSATLKSQEWDSSFTTYRVGDVAVTLSVANPKSGATFLLLVKHCPTTLANCPWDADAIGQAQTSGAAVTATVASGPAGLWLIQVGSPKSHSSSGSVATLTVVAETDQ